MPHRFPSNPCALGPAVAAAVLLACAWYPQLAPPTFTPPSPTARPTLEPAPDTAESPVDTAEPAGSIYGGFLYARAELMESSQSIVLRINQERGQAGVDLLQPEAGLRDLAFLRSEDMIAREYFSHQDPKDGTTPADLLLPALGYGGLLSEIIFATTAPLADVPGAAVTWWMNSGVHRRNLLEPRFHYLGIGLMGDGTWWKVTGLLAESGSGP